MKREAPWSSADVSKGVPLFRLVLSHRGTYRARNSIPNSLSSERCLSCALKLKARELGKRIPSLGATKALSWIERRNSKSSEISGNYER